MLVRCQSPQVGRDTFPTVCQGVGASTTVGRRSNERRRCPYDGGGRGRGSGSWRRNGGIRLVQSRRASWMCARASRTTKYSDTPRFPCSHTRRNGSSTPPQGLCFRWRPAMASAFERWTVVRSARFRSRCLGPVAYQRPRMKKTQALPSFGPKTFSCGGDGGADLRCEGVACSEPIDVSGCNWRLGEPSVTP
jgi:hypothetical protein